MKKQYMPQEIEVWYIIPSIRRELAKAMAVRGLKQKRVAELLGITGAAVSQYLKQKRAKEVDFKPETMAEIRNSADRIINNSDMLICEMQRLLKVVKKSKTLCKVHYRFGRMPQKCEACLEAE
ncbi:transcriptional regulator [Candidatus Woesearchaeota archaeon]|nr:transcriptional regulator [Candidatus Woesearchaeota archaeon]